MFRFSSQGFKWRDHSYSHWLSGEPCLKYKLPILLSYSKNIAIIGSRKCPTFQIITRKYYHSLKKYWLRSYHVPGVLLWLKDERYMYLQRVTTSVEHTVRHLRLVSAVFTLSKAGAQVSTLSLMCFVISFISTSLWLMRENNKCPAYFTGLL